MKGIINFLNLKDETDHSVGKQETDMLNKLNLNPNDEYLNNSYGEFLEYTLHDYHKAKLYYEKSLNINNENITTHILYANLLKNHFRDGIKAQKHYLEAISLNSNDIIALYNYAVLLAEQLCDYAGAKFHYEKVLELSPSWDSPHCNYGILLQYHFQDPVKARYHYEEALKLNPNNQYACQAYALLLTSRCEYEAAKSYYERALQIDPNFTEARNNHDLLLKQHFQGTVNRKQLELESIKAIQVVQNQGLTKDNVQEEKQKEFITSKRSSLLSVSGLGALIDMLEQRQRMIKNQDVFVNNLIKNSGKDENLLTTAKGRSLEKEQKILLSIMALDTINSFLRNIIIMENKFNKLYEPYKSKQKLARSLYGLNISVYEKRPKPISESDSFIDLLTRQSIYKSSFSEFIEKIREKCKNSNIKINSCTSAQLKDVERAFYKTFYLYGGNCQELTDLIRCSFVFECLNDLYHCYQIIEEESKDIDGILRVKDRFEPDQINFGYRDLMINVYCPKTKIVCEIQLHLKIFYDNKHESHEVYKKSRLFDLNGRNLAYDYADKFVRSTVIIQSTENNVIFNTDQIKLNSTNWKMQLQQRRLESYIPILEKNGYDDPDDWEFLSEDELKKMGFLPGHIKRFLRLVKDDC